MKDMKRYILIVFLAVLAIGMNAQNADVLTLDSCFALAKANNAQIRTNQIEIEKAKEVKKQVYTKYFPQVSAGYLAYYAVNPIIRYGVNDIHDELGEILKAIIELLNEDGAHIPTEVELMHGGHSISATAIQPIYAGGRVRNGNKLAKLGIEAAELKGQVSERDMLENIESTYYLIVGLKSKVGTLETALNLIDSLDRVADVAFKAGLVTKNDKLRVALERNKFQAMQLQLNNGIVLASQLLCQEIGIEYPEEGLNLDDDINRADVFTENECFERPANSKSSTTTTASPKRSYFRLRLINTSKDCSTIILNKYKFIEHLAVSPYLSDFYASQQTLFRPNYILARFIE